MPRYQTMHWTGSFHALDCRIGDEVKGTSTIVLKLSYHKFIVLEMTALPQEKATLKLQLFIFVSSRAALYQ